MRERSQGLSPDLISHMNTKEPSQLDGFDPLSEKLEVTTMDISPFEAATQRAVLNILKSYTGYFDVFSELTQNALDAIDARKRLGVNFTPKISIDINISGGVITVSDNGIGMDEGELRYCFRPSVSFKLRKEARGHKGVGATFLAYGFESICVWTVKNGAKLAVRLANGRTWAESINDYKSRPKLEDISGESSAKFPESGTVVEIVIGKSNRPDLTWWNATAAWQWLEILRIKTPLGGVYLKGDSSNFGDRQVEVKVTDLAGNATQATTEKVEYLYPHDLKIFQRIKSVKDAHEQTQGCHGDSLKIPSDFKNLSAMWEIWTCEDMLNDEDSFWNSCFTDAEKKLLLLHDVTVYAFFASTAKAWTEHQVEHLKIRKAPVLLKGGYQIASDFMVQGDLNVIPLTSTIGYQANTHIVVHFRDGNPDMGRKVFQPEIKELAERCSRQCVNIFKRFLHLMREDTGAPTFDESAELYEWQKAQERYAEANPLPSKVGESEIFYVSKPQTEQDVIALFHQLIGAKILRGYKFLSISQILRYDGCFRIDYTSADSITYSPDTQPLGVNQSASKSKLSKPLVLEFKSDLDSLISDVEKEIKCLDDIDLLVCWSMGDAALSRFRIRSYLLPNEGSGRRYFGATHALYSEKVLKFEILCLEDLFGFFERPDECIAANRLKYGNF
jgi:hypothetical protein